MIDILQDVLEWVVVLFLSGVALIVLAGLSISFFFSLYLGFMEFLKVISNIQ